MAIVLADNYEDELLALRAQSFEFVENFAKAEPVSMPPLKEYRSPYWQIGDYQVRWVLLHRRQRNGKMGYTASLRANERRIGLNDLLGKLNGRWK